MRSKRFEAVRGAAVAAAVLALAGCAEHSHRITPAAAVTTAEAGSTTLTPSRRQYYDQRRKRYYYFDPARRAYFWEDGTPKT